MVAPIIYAPAFFAVVYTFATFFVSPSSLWSSGFFTDARLSRRFVQGLVAPSGYNYAWAVDDARLTMLNGAASAYYYMYRISIDYTANTINQSHVSDCTGWCDATLDCAMAHLVLFNDKTNSEGNVVCALYNHTVPDSSYATTRNDGDNSMGTVKSSYEFDKIFDGWFWNQVEGTMCSEGSETGYGLNAHQSSTDVVINFQGGGVCYDYATCYLLGRAVNMGIPFNEATFIAQNVASGMENYFITSRNDAENPFNQASFAYIPYCTGDLHSGNSSIVYAPFTKATHHSGALNSQLMMQAIKEALPNTRRVWISGSSAGGFGAILQYIQAQSIFGPNVRIDMIADSSEAYGDGFFYPSLDLILPSASACPKCTEANFDSFLPALVEMNPNSRFASISYAHDTILPGYESVDQASMDAEVTALFKTLNTFNNAKTFIMPGAGHVVLGNTNNGAASNGVTLAAFFQNMKNDSTGWTSGV